MAKTDGEVESLGVDGILGRSLGESAVGRVIAGLVSVVVVLLVATLGFITARELTRGYVHTHGREIVDAAGRPIRLRSIGLGMWLVPEGYMFKFGGEYQSPTQIEGLTKDLLGDKGSREFWTQFRDAFVTEDDIKAIKEFGFDSIRLPFHYRLLSPKLGVYNEAGFSYLDRVIKWASMYDLMVVLDMHCAPGGQTGTNIDDSSGQPELWGSDANKKHAVAVWRTIAKRYSGNTTVIGYDLLNEPIAPQFSYAMGELEPMYRDIVKAIREVDTNHMVFLEGANWANNWSVFSEPFDKNAVYSFHKYWDENGVDTIIYYLAFRNQHSVPIWLGETGENSTQWYSEMVSLIEDNKIGWAFWPWKKISSDNCPYVITAPLWWDEIVAYTNGGPRPSRETSREAFDELLANVKFANCQPNPLVQMALEH